MSLFFKARPFKDNNGELIDLKTIEIIDFGALNDEVTVEFTFKGRWLENGHEGIEGTSLNDLQKDIEWEWNNGSEFLKTKRWKG
jgi:hypothetical protein